MVGTSENGPFATLEGVTYVAGRMQFCDIVPRRAPLRYLLSPTIRSLLFNTNSLLRFVVTYSIPNSRLRLVVSYSIPTLFYDS
jgi:hypothetical protein